MTDRERAYLAARKVADQLGVEVSPTALEAIVDAALESLRGGTPTEEPETVTDDRIPCRLCGTPTRRRKRSGFANKRSMLKHKCPHGEWCVAGRKGQMGQTLTAWCKECNRLGHYGRRMAAK